MAYAKPLAAPECTTRWSPEKQNCGVGVVPSGVLRGWRLRVGAKGMLAPRVGGPCFLKAEPLLQEIPALLCRPLHTG